jgi:hypothetical protein
MAKPAYLAGFFGLLLHVATFGFASTASSGFCIAPGSA